MKNRVKRHLIRGNAPHCRKIEEYIVLYQQTLDPKYYHELLRFLDKLLIRIVNQIYRMGWVKNIEELEKQEVYHIVVLTMERAIRVIKVTDRFTIGWLALYIRTYSLRELNWRTHEKINYVRVSKEFFKDETGHREDENIKDFELKNTFWSIVNRFVDMGKITMDHGKMLERHVFKEESYGEIARDLGLPKTTVRFQIQKVKNLIKEKYGIEEFLECHRT